MSRSAFAARFTALVGESAMHYVTRRACSLRSRCSESRTPESLSWRAGSATGRRLHSTRRSSGLSAARQAPLDGGQSRECVVLKSRQSSGACEVSSELTVVPIGHVSSPLRHREHAPKQGNEGSPHAWLVLDARVQA